MYRKRQVENAFSCAYKPLETYQSHILFQHSASKPLLKSRRTRNIYYYTPQLGRQQTLLNMFTK